MTSLYSAECVEVITATNGEVQLCPVTMHCKSYYIAN